MEFARITARCYTNIGCFNQLCASCPHHQISDQLLLQYFYEGLLLMDHSMIDATSEGVRIEKTSKEARELILKMVANSQQFGVCVDSSRSFNEVIHSNIETKLSELTSLVKQVTLDRLDKSKSVVSALSRTILLIDVLNYKMMII